MRRGLWRAWSAQRRCRCTARGAHDGARQPRRCGPHGHRRRPHAGRPARAAPVLARPGRRGGPMRGCAPGGRGRPRGAPDARGGARGRRRRPAVDRPRDRRRPARRRRTPPARRRHARPARVGPAGPPRHQRSHRCLDHRAHVVDQVRPALVDQVRLRPERARAQGSVRTAGTAVSRALRALDTPGTRQPGSVDAILELRAPNAVGSVLPVTRHPVCGCGWAGGTRTMVG